MSATPDFPDRRALAERLARLPEIEAIRRALAARPVYLVGGAVRDLLLDRAPAAPDLDLVVEGDAIALAHEVGGVVAEHARFLTATVRIGEVEVDLATARTERYERPGALPEVAPATLRDDLGRRDFTVNAMALPLHGEPELIDPHGGARDLAAGVLRVLHERSFRDDPTRALRAARYAARLGLEPDEPTGRLLREADTASVSRERVEAELRLIAAEPSAARALELLAAWRVAEVEASGAARAAAALAVLELPGWRELADRGEVVLAALGPHEPGPELLAAPERPSQGVARARGRSGTELVLARAAGASWLDDYVRSWRGVRLEIGGGDLLAAGVPEGPRVGAGLRAALAAKLDGGAAGREEELRIALAAAA